MRCGQGKRYKELQESSCQAGWAMGVAFPVARTRFSERTEKRSLKDCLGSLGRGGGGQTR